jgi:hypothetical protein
VSGIAEHGVSRKLRAKENNHGRTLWGVVLQYIVILRYSNLLLRSFSGLLQEDGYFNDNN